MAKQPNIVIMYADDLGFGDLACYGAEGIPTPNLDKLAANGRRFTSAYASAATCTPSRYSLLTGNYPWRESRAAILPGDAPLIIEPGSPTLPSLLQQAGYKTSVVGKWHLGLGDGTIDWNGEIHDSPLDVGFDESYIMAATNDRVPCVYVDGRAVENLDPNDPISVRYGDEGDLPGELPLGKERPDLLRMHFSHQHDDAIINGVSRIGRMAGGASALWVDEEMGERFLGRAKDFVSRHQEQPFFLFYAFHQPHVPRLPSPKFAGSTNQGPRGDVIAEMDWCVGEFLAHLDSLGLSEDTIVIFSSDNGPVLDDGYQDQAEELVGDHRPAGPLRGSKYSLYDGGTRVPTILSWPGTVAPGTSDALVSQVDLTASFAALAGVDLPAGSAADSFDMREALFGDDEVGRDEILAEGIYRTDVIRQGSWVCIPPHDPPSHYEQKNVELGRLPDPQLFDLSDDLGQRQDVASEQPERVASMRARIDEIHAGSGTRV